MAADEKAINSSSETTGPVAGTAAPSVKKRDSDGIHHVRDIVAYLKGLSKNDNITDNAIKALLKTLAEDLEVLTTSWNPLSLMENAKKLNDTANKLEELCLRTPWSEDSQHMLAFLINASYTAQEVINKVSEDPGSFLDYFLGSLVNYALSGEGLRKSYKGSLNHVKQTMNAIQRFAFFQTSFKNGSGKSPEKKNTEVETLNNAILDSFGLNKGDTSVSIKTLIGYNKIMGSFIASLSPDDKKLAYVDLIRNQIKENHEKIMEAKIQRENAERNFLQEQFKPLDLQPYEFYQVFYQTIAKDLAEAVSVKDRLTLAPETEKLGQALLKAEGPGEKIAAEPAKKYYQEVSILRNEIIEDFNRIMDSYQMSDPRIDAMKTARDDLKTKASPTLNDCLAFTQVVATNARAIGHQEPSLFRILSTFVGETWNKICEFFGRHVQRKTDTATYALKLSSKAFELKIEKMKNAFEQVDILPTLASAKVIN